ncbi:helix-turn-helix transcriptional regulator [Halopelagius inordinatus]|uniref:helix-turn-helix transcriptional regulator n=1 Tax=Halopelagius inordinatus TaxID=553467 RepID=UPI001FEBF152|nr:transcriptional regulator FilR1 domain-containing protein [Halopelagius inordinatus]
MTSSTTRESVLCRLVDSRATTQDLCAELEGSESGIYAATSELHERGLIRRDDDDEWSLTGIGLVVSEVVSDRRRLDELLASDADYWRTHDATALPNSFRGRLQSLREADVIRVSDADPAGIVRLIHEQLVGSERVAVVAPVHFPNLGRTLRTVCREHPGRLVVTDAVIEAIRRHDDGVVPVPENLSIRVLDVEFALAVTDETTFLSLPTLDGEYDAKTEIVADDEESMEWALDLFEWSWRRAMPIADHSVPTRSI